MRTLTSIESTIVSGGTYACCCAPAPKAKKAKGNNGFGNGGNDGSNAGKQDSTR